VRFQAGASGFGTLKGQMPVVAARALRALTLQLKLQLLRYGPVEPRVWKQMGRICAYAEEKAVSTVSIIVYPGAFGESTVQREFLRTGPTVHTVSRAPAVVLWLLRREAVRARSLRSRSRKSTVRHLGGAERVGARPPDGRGERR